MPCVFIIVLRLPTYKDYDGSTHRKIWPAKTTKAVNTPFAVG